jgi:DNA-binding NarL/FixJ family response regulator
MRVVLAEDNALLRDGITLVLADHDIDVVAAVDNATDLLAAVDATRPDLAIVDVRMPPTHTDEGIRAALHIRADHPGTAVLMFSQWIETTYARRLLSDHTGSVGYLLKDRVTATADFVAAVHRVAAGGTALGPDVVNQLLARPALDAGLARLTPREREILGLLAEGRSNQAIADDLVLAIRSVEKNVASIFTKLDLPPHTDDHRRVLAVLRYLEPGWPPRSTTGER